jgi:hypothetical protein
VSSFQVHRFVQVWIAFSLIGIHHTSATTLKKPLGKIEKNSQTITPLCFLTDNMQAILSNKLYNSTSFLYLAFGFSRYITGFNDEWYRRETTFAENFGVAEGEEIQDWGGIFALSFKIFFALLSWH